MATQKLRLPEMTEAQAQKHLTFNEAMTDLDVLVLLSVKDKDLTSPPGSPSEGDKYIVGASATGAWSGYDTYITGYYNGAWEFYNPRAGWTTYVEDEDLFLTYRNLVWGPVEFGYADTFISTVYTVATLPSASTLGAGARAFVSDASGPTFGATVAGGGAVNVPVYSDGTNWKVG